mmetsp:Transcript_23505/g.53015  ORF Transcript_23505/g.53015 Transcript_23505/m.53015 type:complete len:364 (+) Transcript_23505:3-1094(+)
MSRRFLCCLALATPTGALNTLQISLSPRRAVGYGAIGASLPIAGNVDGSVEPRLEQAYNAAGLATMGTWAACSVASLATYKPHRLMHNSIGVIQALTALPLIWACTRSLASAAHADGRKSMRARECLRLNLGLAASSIWSIIAVIASPVFTAAQVRTVDPVLYPPALAITATVVHALVASLCLDSWRRAVSTPSIDRVISGFLGSVARLLGPSWPSADDPDVAPIKVNEYNFLALAFGGFALGAIFAPFPLATVPSLLGKRFARAFGAWSFLASVVFVELKDAAAAQCDENSSAKVTHTILRRGVFRMAISHLVVALARPIFESKTVYPAAMDCRPAVVASLAVYILALRTVSSRKELSICTN